MTNNIEFNESEKNILTEIGYYFKRNVDKLDTKSVKFENNIIYITLGRPGLLIGKKGEDINSLMETFKIIFGPEVKLEIIESRMDNWLRAFEYSEIDDFETL